MNLNLNLKDKLGKLRRKADAPALEERGPQRDPSVVIEVGGKRLVFGLEWKVLLGEGDVHRDARKIQAPYLWTAEKSPFVGFVHRPDRKQKLKEPMYAGAIALLNRYPDTPNVLFIAEVPDVGYVICGFHQRRPKEGFDLVLPLTRTAKIGEILHTFGKICGDQDFLLYGNVGSILNISRASLEDLVKGADNGAQVRKVKSALINPAFAAVSITVVVAVGWWGIHTYTKYRDAERQRNAMAAQKNSQQLYTEELNARRSDAALPAKAITRALAPIGAMYSDLGGWGISHAECTVAVEKQLSCTFKFTRALTSSATNLSFAAAAKGMFDSVTYGQTETTATKAIKLPDFVVRGAVIDTGKTQDEENLEFGSALQRCSRIGKANVQPFQPYAVPAGVNIAELTSPPIGTAEWDWNAPFRAMKALADFPDYVTISKITIDFTRKPSYDMHQSMAMVTVAGNIFTKPN
jgi:hypothetical protein